MELKVKTLSGSDAGKQAVGFDFVQEGKGNQAVHDTVVAYMAAQRTGTAKTKNRAEVSGTGKKPWRQKGTGRARTGSLRTNIFRGGGVTHGPRPRDFSKKVNAKTRQLALRKALSERMKNGEVILVDSLKLDDYDTGKLDNQILGLAPEAKSVLLVHDLTDNQEVKHLCYSARNIPLVDVIEAGTLNTYDVLKYDALVLSTGALELVTQRLTD